MGEWIEWKMWWLHGWMVRMKDDVGGWMNRMEVGWMNGWIE